MSIDCTALFASNYTAAREKFRTAAGRVGAQLEAWRNPNAGPDGAPLNTDVAWLGPRDAQNVLILQSGTHGLEGYAGSACQIAWLTSQSATALPPGVAVLMIHLINPHGLAWSQRETEEGVDLNRNFIDFSQPRPQRPHYALLHEALSCPDLDGPRYDAAEAVLRAFRAEHGLNGYVRAIMSGQYGWADGMSYGGDSPAWSNRTFTAIVRKYVACARRVVFLDYHTGLGPYGHASLISLFDAKHPVARRALEWFGPSVWAAGLIDEQNTALNGDIGNAIIAALPNATVTPLVVEYGTLDVESEIRVLRQDFWLRRHGDSASPLGRTIKNELCDYFHPPDHYWREIVVFRSQQIIRQGLDALASGSD